MTPPKIHRSWVIHTSAFLGLGLLTALMTYPLVFQLTRSVPGWPGDNLQSMWFLWWFKRALLDLNVSPTINPFVFVPDGFALARTEMFWANTILALPITAIGGPILAYNLMLFLSFVLSGFATYLWVRRLTGSHVAGFFSGLIFAFSPYRMAHYPGHLGLMATQWLPFLFFALEELARTRRLCFAVLAGLFFALNAWAAWYYFYFSLIAVPLYALIRFREWRPRLKSRIFWQAVGLSLIVALALIVPAAWPYLKLHGGGEMRRAFTTMEFWAANPTDFIVPNLLHPLWGEALHRFVPFQWELWVEKSLYLGLLPLTLALVAFLKKRSERAVWALACLALASYLLALGPSLQWAGQRVHVAIPTGLMALLYHLGVTPYLTPRLEPNLLADMQLNHYFFVPLPTLLLYLFVPFTSVMRAVGRFGMITILSVAAMAGYGLTFVEKRMASRHKHWGWTIPSLAIAVILFEFLALPHQMTALQPRPIDLWLAEQPTGVMVELPLADGHQPLAHYYYPTIHQQPMVFGPIDAGFVPQTAIERLEHLASFPDEESMTALAEYGTTYVLVHTGSFENWPQQVEPWAATGQLRELRCFDTLCAYAMEPSS